MGWERGHHASGGDSPDWGRGVRKLLAPPRQSLRAPGRAIGRASSRRRPVPPTAAGPARCSQWTPSPSPTSQYGQPMVRALGGSWLFRGKKDLARKSGRDFAGSGGRGAERDRALAAACRHGPAPPPLPATRAARAVSAMAVAPAGGPCAPALEALLGAGALRLLDSSQIVIISTAQDASAPPAPAAPAAGPRDPDLLLFATPQAPRPTPSAPRPALGRPPVRTPGTLGRVRVWTPVQTRAGRGFWPGGSGGGGGPRLPGWAGPSLGWASGPRPGVRGDLGPVPVCSSTLGLSFPEPLEGQTPVIMAHVYSVGVACMPVLWPTSSQLKHNHAVNSVLSLCPSELRPREGK